MTQTTIPGLPSDVAGADVPRELAGIITDDIIDGLVMYGITVEQQRHRATPVPKKAMYPKQAKDLLMQKLCSYCVSLQHVALLEGMKRKGK